MSQPDQLLVQLANRVRAFSAGTDISINRIAALIGVESSNFSAFVNGRAGLSAVSVCRLMEVLGSSKRQLELKLNAKPIEIRHFQSNGEAAQFDARIGGGWVPGRTEDPNNVPGNDVTNTPTARGDFPSTRDDLDQATIDFLRQQQGLYRSADQAIEDFLSPPKATVNRTGDQRTAGSQPSRFNR